MPNVKQLRWRKRLATIEVAVDDIILPDADDSLDQDQEWCEVVAHGRRQRVRFHDYHAVYAIPGFYELLFYDRLKCNSPSRVVGLLREVMRDFRHEPADLRVLDIGAGNGMVGDELHAAGARHMIGVDIIDEARQAAERDRPGVYQDYLVTDLTDLPEQHEEHLRKQNLNALTTVAALGYGDIPDKAFLKGLDLIETPAWLAFNIKEDFVKHRNDTGFCRLIRQLSDDGVIQIQAWRRYRHRLSVAGKPLYYVAMVARKTKDVPDHLMES